MLTFLHKLKFILIIVIFTAAGLYAQEEMGRPKRKFARTNMGVAVIGARQDAAQIGGYGLGPGVEIFLQRITTSSLLFSFGVGIISLNDGIFLMDKQRTLLMPSVNCRLGYAVIHSYKFILSPYIGIHAFNAMKKSILESEIIVSERTFQGGYFLGISLTKSISYPASLYIDLGQRQVLISPQEEKIKYTALTIGIIF
jgi:hypothetical protein